MEQNLGESGWVLEVFLWRATQREALVHIHSSV